MHVASRVNKLNLTMIGDVFLTDPVYCGETERNDISDRLGKTMLNKGESRWVLLQTKDCFKQ